MPYWLKATDLNDDYDEDDDPNNPSHRDYDLSEAGIGSHEEYDSKPFFLRRGVLIVVSVLVLLGLLLPFIRVFGL
jgi:hypothetical protein